MTSKGHIYMIITPLDNSFCYIGSTFNRLHKRFEGHKKAFKRKDKCSIHPFFEKYGIENFKIILIKSYDVIRTHKKDFKHLCAYELLWINKTKNCVNKLLPFNPLLKFDKKIIDRKYYENHKEKLKKYQKKYRHKNKEVVYEKQKQKYNCVCGSIISIRNKSQHEKSKKHIKFCQKI
jgi:hypothetical protein